VWTAEVDRIVYLVDESAAPPTDENAATRRSTQGWTRSDRRELQTFRPDVQNFVVLLVREAEEEHLQQQPVAAKDGCICEKSRNAEEAEEEDTDDENKEELEGDNGTQDSHEDRKHSDKVRSLLVRGDLEDTDGDSQECTKKSQCAHDDENPEALESQVDENDEEISEEDKAKDDNFLEKLYRESQSLDRGNCIRGETHNTEEVVQEKNHDEDDNVEETGQKHSQAHQPSDDVNDLLAECSVQDQADQKFNPRSNLEEISDLANQEEEFRSIKNIMQPEPANSPDRTSRSEQMTAATQEHETLEPPAPLSNIDGLDEKDRSDSGSNRNALRIPVRGLFRRMMRNLRTLFCCASPSQWA
jgi:hypothetical protein